MSMHIEHEELKATLQQLREQIQSGQPIDPQLATLLQQLSADVNQLTLSEVESVSPLAADGLSEKQTLMDRMLGLTEEFEETHPQLAEAIGRVATALSRIGI